jgi:cytosine/adenosine deaminase-related metal-dependent hydrolase
MPIEWLRPAIVPHAPYSVSPALFAAIRKDAGEGPCSIHLAESAEEVQFLSCGGGAWRAVLEAVGAWDPGWSPPRCGPIEYMARLGVLDERLLAVHAVQATDEELGRLAAAGATVVTCPRSNAWTGAGDPPVARFFAAGVRVAVGTDSLASVADLNVFAEMAAMRALAPSVPARRILESATRHGAEALGFAADLGTLERGKRAELIAVDLPHDDVDVEEYLVRGVGPEAIRWLDQG